MKQKIGIIGGGQLGMMLTQTAKTLDFDIYIYQPSQDDFWIKAQTHQCKNDKKESFDVIPADKFFTGEYSDKNKILEFATEVDFITYEFENIPYEVIANLEQHKCSVHPNSNAIRIAQNRLLEKNFFLECGIKTPKFKEIKSITEIDFFPSILKTASGGYDGKGQFFLKSKEDSIGLQLDPKCQYILEGVVEFICEFSLILTRDAHENIIFFPINQNIHEKGILRQTIIPFNFEWNQKVSEIHEIGKIFAEKLNYVGTLAIEFFLDRDLNIIANEFAPRVHNSGHWTIEGCDVSQFENHIRAISGMEIKNPTLRFNNIIMLNLLGNDIENYESKYLDLLVNKEYYVHTYGKSDVREGRKMGHITIFN